MMRVRWRRRWLEVGLRNRVSSILGIAAYRNIWIDVACFGNAHSCGCRKYAERIPTQQITQDANDIGTNGGMIKGSSGHHDNMAIDILIASVNTVPVKLEIFFHTHR